MRLIFLLPILIAVALLPTSAFADGSTVHLPIIHQWAPPPAIAFASGGRIFRVEHDGSNLQQLTFNEPIGSYNSYDIEPDWSSKTNQIVFTRTYYKHADIYLVGDGGGVTRELILRNARTPTWSPNGKKIAFAMVVRGFPWGNTDLAMANADGTDSVKITDTLDTPNERNPHWSPKRAILVYDDSRDIYTIDANGSNNRRLTASPSVDVNPVFSPDASQIAYEVSDSPGGTAHIYVMDANGANPRRLIEGAEAETAPDWSIETGEIVASVLIDGRWELWIVEPKSGKVTEKLRFDMDAFEPCWQR